MELIDLPDGELEHIFKFLNTKSQLNTMLVCKRFENLIGSMLYKKFHLKLGKKVWDNYEKCQELMNIRRKFGVVELNGIDFDETENHFKILYILEVLRKKGDSISELIITDSKLSETTIGKFLELTKNVRKIALKNVELVEDEEENSHQYQRLGSLKEMSVEKVKNLNVLSKVMKSSLLQLKICGKSSLSSQLDQFRDDYQQFLLQQKKLRNLTFKFLQILVFEYSRELLEITELTVEGLVFEGFETDQHFKDFLKNCQKLESLRLKIPDGDYSEVLPPLLNQKTLKKLELSFSPSDFDRFHSNMRICNIFIKHLGIFGVRPLQISYNILVRYFPSVSSLSIITPFPDWNERESMRESINMSPINTWNLKKLELSFETDRVLSQLRFRELKQLIIHNCFQGRNYSNQGIWRNFFIYHQSLERVELKFDHHLSYLRDVLKNLPNLKHLTFEVFVDSGSENTALLTIASYHDKLESYKIGVKGTTYRERPERPWYNEYDRYLGSYEYEYYYESDYSVDEPTFILKTKP